MPELPEVETIRADLAPLIKGHSFTAVTILDGKIVVDGSVDQFRTALIGQRVEGIRRRGKYLVFSLSNGGALMMHLRMTGALLLSPSEADRYARAQFHFDNGCRLVFRDQRRFGVIRLVDDACAELSKLGPEPFDRSFSPVALAERLSRRRIPIKAALLDQSIVAGIGNMYADEALFAARIHPLRKSNDLSPGEVRALHESIRLVLRAAIDCRGASVDTYIRPDGQQGTAHCGFKVAHRGGQACRVCGSTIQRVAIQSRGSYFCPKCQPLRSKHPTT
jgi:formamidopyrimidine-DNA glycosylase